MLPFRKSGESLPRNADRTSSGVPFQLPPRSTRFEPVDGPRGSADGAVTIAVGFSLQTIQNKVHEHAVTELFLFPGDLSRRATVEQDDSFWGQLLVLERTRQSGRALRRLKRPLATGTRIVPTGIDDQHLE